MHKNIKSKLTQMRIDEESDFLFPHIEFDSNKRATIDGSKGVLEYNNNVVRLNCGDVILKFAGDTLEIKTVCAEQIIVSGQIVCVEFSAL